MICYNCGVYCTYPDEEYYEDEDDYYDNFYGEEDGQYYYEDDYNDEDYGEEEEYEEEFDYYNDEDDHREKRCYGCFQCPNCRKRWDSAYVFCRKQRGSLRPLYKQACKACRVSCLPYKVKPLRCSQCWETNCTCDRRHSDVHKPHRSDLCQRCRSGRPCTQTYGPPCPCPY
ncbi:zygote arrest protein 1-like isoform X2 [Pomacea canaliculata]|uniref:zygote arrest protein 1-like isoform X2 n=1 Tax=Pomacea canaliculata TaxID=400727 RepID=UPI000D7280CB|nr:zygote arrest protein 1-like isoform X2 [Pomacea canaliculata]